MLNYANLVESEYGTSVLQQLETMQEPEASKLQKCNEWSIPQGVSIDANEQVNGWIFAFK